MTYGYIRVSTKEQNEVRQLVALSDYGIEKRYLYMDKQSGKDFLNGFSRKTLLKHIQKPKNCQFLKKMRRKYVNFR